VKSTLLATPSYRAATSTSATGSITAAVVEDQQQIFVSQKIEVDLSKPGGSSLAGEASAGRSGRKQAPLPRRLHLRQARQG